MPAESHFVRASIPRYMIYYRIPLHEDAKVPQLAERHRGNPDSGAAHRNADPAPLPAAPVPARATVATIFTRPEHPDNPRQTIYQSVSPPDLKIKTELPLPNIVALSTPTKPKFPLAPQYSRPSSMDRPIDSVTSPTISETNPQEQLRIIANSSDNLLPAPSSPIARGPRVGPEADSADLLVVGLDPSNSSADLSLPAGNRWANVAIGPPAPGPGSGADSDSANDAPKGTGAAAAGYGAAAGNGNGRGSGGKNGKSDRGDAGVSSPIAVGGSGHSVSGNGLLVQLAPGIVYPVVQPSSGIRRNTMVISAGPMGGGGLRMYGALKCASIYSVFLPMPGKNWSLQYCEASSGSAQSTTEIHPSAIHLDKPLIPPDVDLDRRFDFKRTPVQGPKANHLIILKGVIGTDGTVRDLAVYQGVSAELDEAARVAFGQWHFKPAMRDGKAVAVEILVGIPSVTTD